MSAQPPSGQSQIPQPSVESKQNDKEINLVALRQKYERELAQERSARIEAEKIAQEAQKRNVQEEDDDDQPYVDHKKLKKEQARFGQQLKNETQGEIQKAVQLALQEERKQNWIKQNSDFYEVLQHAEKLAQKDPELAETILEMPEGFERQKLVYKNIKALGLHKPETKTSSIQEKIESNRRSPFYQPSGVGSAPYAAAGDFSPTGQKQAFEKMQELKNRLRI